MALTGRADGPPLVPPAPVVPRLAALAGHIAASSEALGRRVDVDVAATLGARAAEAGLVRRGSVSANQACRLLRAGDGRWWALNLARPDDVAALPAVLGWAGSGDPWADVAAAGATRGRDELVERCRLLGIPAAPAPQPPAPPSPAPPRPSAADPTAPAHPPSHSPSPPWRRRRLAPRAPQIRRPATVVDLSALWAGPLCAHLLRRAGLHVVKVESVARPDALRSGAPALFERLHRNQELVTVDWRAPEGRAELRRRLAGADVVIEGSRGRALDQLGLGPDDVAHRRGAVWLTITGYGRSSPWVAFGDDAAVAGGLVAWDEHGPVFCGDAMADPIAGMTGAWAVLAALGAGGGEHLDLAMADAVAAVAAPPTAGDLAGDPADGNPADGNPADGNPACGRRDYQVFVTAEGQWRARCRRHRAEAAVAPPPGTATDGGGKKLR